MISRENTTLICPNNDLESRTILEIARHLGMDVRESRQPWGARLGAEPEENRERLFHDLKDNVLVIEMPDPAEEERLTRKGHHFTWIDHHRYTIAGKPLDRSDSRSSIEQFAELVGYTLNEHELLIACNDRGSYWAMATETEGSLEQMLQVVEADLEVQGYTEEIKDKSAADYDKGVIFNASSEQCFCLVTTTQEKSSYLAHLHQQPTDEELKKYREEGKSLPVKALLVLALDPDKKEVRQVNFYGSAAFLAKLDAVEQSIGGRGSGYEFWRGGGTDSAACFWGGKRSGHGRKPWACDELANSVLTEFIVYDRPLLKYSTVFFYPFKVNGEVETISGKWVPKSFEVEDRSYQEYVYFHPYARKFLYHTFPPPSSGEQGPVLCGAGDAQTDKLTAIDYYTYDPLKHGDRDAHLEIIIKERSWSPEGEKTEHKRPISYPVEHMAIHSFLKHSRLCIMAIQVTQSVVYQELMEHELVEQAIKSSKIEKDEKFLENLDRKVSFWRLCTARDYFARKHLTCRDTLLFNELARKTYLSFTEQLEEGDVSKIPVRVRLTIEGEDPLEHTFKKEQLELTWDRQRKTGRIQISTIIQDLLESALGSQCFSPILDDRMVVFTFFGLAGGQPRSSKGCEDYQALFSRIMYVESPGTGFCYDREFMKDLSEHVVYRRWYNLGNLYGFTRYSSAYSGYGGFFSNEIFNNFNSMYYQLAVISLFYRMSLIEFSDDVADATLKLELGNPDRKIFLTIKKAFMDFSNIYWFQEVTNQDEGIEIFDCYKKSFMFENMYNQVKEEIDRADKYFESIDGMRYVWLSNRCAIGGLLFGALAVLTGYFGMNFNDLPSVKCLFFKTDVCFWIITSIVLLVSFSIGFLIFIKERWWRNIKSFVRNLARTLFKLKGGCE